MSALDERAPATEGEAKAPETAEAYARFQGRLRAAIEASGLTERALSLKAGLSRAQVSQLLRVSATTHGPGVLTVAALARAAGVSPGWLAFGEGEGGGVGDEGRAPPSPPRLDVVPRTCTLTELARLAGRSTKVVRGWLDECCVPIHGNGVGRHIVVDDLAVRRPEIYRLFQRRAEDRARASRENEGDEAA